MSRQPVRQHSGDRSAHTPGPWRFNPVATAGCWLEGLNGENAISGITIFHIDPYGNDTPNEADARLIAAAPTMLAALQEIVVPTGIDVRIALKRARDLARHAIAAAVGDRPDAAQPPIQREP